MRVWEWDLPSIGGLFVEATPHRTQLTGLQEQIHVHVHVRSAKSTCAHYPNCTCPA